MEFDFESVGVRTAGYPTRYIDIVVDICAVAQKAAMLKRSFGYSDYGMPSDWPDSSVLTEEGRKIYRRVIADAIGVIDSFGFDLQEDDIEFWDTGSCYVNFVPKNYDGEYYEELVQARFRLSDHESIDGVDSFADGRLFMMFTVNGFQTESIDGFLDAISFVCGDLMMGDFSKLPTS